MLISEAWAQTGGADGGNIFVSLMPLVLIFGVFYFLLIRPQQKRQKAHRESVNALERGDRVLTGGGLYGKIVKIIDENEVIVEIADNVRVRVARMTIQDVIVQPEPISSGVKGGKKSNGDVKDKEASSEGKLINKLAGKKKEES